MVIFKQGVTLDDVIGGDLFLMFYAGKRPDDLHPETAPHPVARAKIAPVDWNRNTGSIHLRQVSECRTIDSGLINFFRVLMMGHGFIAQGDVPEDMVLEPRMVAPRQAIVLDSLGLQSQRWVNQ